MTLRHFEPSDGPTPCRECNGEGELATTPCCDVAFTKKDDDGYYFCTECRKRYATLKCPECHGLGIEK